MSPVKQTKGLDAIIIETRQNVFLISLTFKRLSSETCEVSESVLYKNFEKYMKIHLRFELTPHRQHLSMILP